MEIDLKIGLSDETLAERSEAGKWECERCGVCCRFIIIPVAEPMNIETEAYLEAHGIAYDVSMTSDGFKGRLIIPAICKYLEVVNDTPIHYKCTIHTDKFVNCRLGGEKECEDAKKAYALLEEIRCLGEAV
jgi:hypothetical protein